MRRWRDRTGRGWTRRVVIWTRRPRINYLRGPTVISGMTDASVRYRERFDLDREKKMKKKTSKVHRRKHVTTRLVQNNYLESNDPGTASANSLQIQSMSIIIAANTAYESTPKPP